MKSITTTIAIFVALVNIASAESIKCAVNGKIIYTDNEAMCTKSSIKSIKGNVSTFPKVTLTNKQQAPSNSTSSASILPDFGVSQEDIANGWKTIMDAKKRGSWKAPEMPDDAK